MQPRYPQPITGYSICRFACTWSLLALYLAGASHAAAAAPATRPIQDYQGRPFVTQPAPILQFEQRLAPRLHGIDYAFPEQTARGVALFDRFPAFHLSDRRIHLSGPWYVQEANGHFTHGITSVESMPMYRQTPNDIRKLPYGRKWQLLGDPMFWEAAGKLASDIERTNPNDPRIPPLRLFNKEHKMSAHEDAYRELGRYIWKSQATQTDAKGQGVRYAMIDIEQSGGWEHQRQCIGWIYQGMAQAAAQKSCTLVPVTYGQWTFMVGAVHFSMRQGGKGEPEYLLPKWDFLQSADPTLKACNDLGGVVSMDGYIQAIWGNEPFHKRNRDGSLVMDQGKPVYSDLDKTTLYGVEFTLEKGEAEHCLQDIYRQAVRMYLMHHWLAGQYPAHSELRRPFLKNIRIGAWTRLTNEGMQGIKQNDRPIPGWLIEMLMGMYLFTADDIVEWGVETNRGPRPLGSDYTDAWKYAIHGPFEYIVKAAHRYSALEPLHQGPFQWCWFKLPMVNQNRTDGEYYHQKPIVIGKIRTYQNKPWLELFAAWPSLDQQPAVLEITIERAGKSSPTYQIELVNGRSYFYDAWQLPADFKDLEGKDVRLRFTDLAGQTRLWRGDWREQEKTRP
ncbi:MAG: hypothetical protein ACM359_17590 [Bacillota bacterium]